VVKFYIFTHILDKDCTIFHTNHSKSVVHAPIELSEKLGSTANADDTDVGNPRGGVFPGAYLSNPV